MYSAISRSIFSIGGKIVLLREKLVVRFTFHGQIENEEKRLFPKGRIIIVIVHVSSSCALVVVFLEGKRKKKKEKPVPENAPFPETMAATYEFKLPSTGG